MLLMMEPHAMSCRFATDIIREECEDDQRVDHLEYLMSAFFPNDLQLLSSQYAKYRRVVGELNRLNEQEFSSGPYEGQRSKILAAIRRLANKGTQQTAPIYHKIAALMAMPNDWDIEREEEKYDQKRRRYQRRLDEPTKRLSDLIDLLGIIYPFGIDLLAPNMPMGKYSTLDASHFINVQFGDDSRTRNQLTIMPSRSEQASVITHVCEDEGYNEIIQTTMKDGEVCVVGHDKQFPTFAGKSLEDKPVLYPHVNTGDNEKVGMATLVLARLNDRIALMTKRSWERIYVRQGDTGYRFSPQKKRGEVYGHTFVAHAEKEGEEANVDGDGETDGETN